MTKTPAPIQKLIAQLRKFPGIGQKTAERYAFELLTWDPQTTTLLASSIASLQSEVTHCPTCNCLQGSLPCELCDPQKRDPSILCIVCFAKDVYPIEDTRIFKGMYHVLGTVFSPLNNRTIEKSVIDKIRHRVLSHAIRDVVLALDSTLEGDATALFLKEEMRDWGISISRLAFGIPLGSSFEYVDSGTLARAFLGRQEF